MPAAAVEAAIERAAGAHLAVDPACSTCSGAPGIAAGRRSLAYALRLQAPDHTLTDAEIADVRQRCIAAVEGALPATLRG